MWRNVFLIISMISLTGCFSEPTDKGCYETMEDLTYDTDMLFNACKSKDRFAQVNNVFDYRSEKEEFVFNESYFITQEEADVKNNFQRSHFAFDESLLALKQKFYDIAFNEKVLMFTLCIVLLLFSFSKNERKHQSIIPSAVLLGMILFVGNVLLNSNELKKNLSRFVMYSGNFVSRLVATATISEININQFSLRDTARAEAFNDLIGLYNSNICLSNNQKLRASAYEMSQGNLFKDQEEIASFFDERHKTVIPMHQNGKGNIKIYTNEVGGYETLGRVSYQNCGFTNYKPKAFDETFHALMKKVDFNNVLIDSVASKSYEKGWESIQANFYANYKSKSQVNTDRLIQLLVAYASEYKKSLVVGSYLFENGSFVDSNVENFKHNLSVADQIYKNINKAICISDYAKAKESIEKVADYNEMKSLRVGTFDCVDFEDGKIKPITDKIYHPESNRIEIEVAVSELQAETKDLVDSEVDKLSAEYTKIADHYIDTVEKLDSKDHILIDLLNEGVYSLGELYKVNMTDNAVYKELFKEIRFISESNYSSVFPYYAHAELIQSTNKAMYTIEFVEKFLPQEKSPDTLLSSNQATLMVKDRYNTDLSSGTEEALDNSFKDRISKLVKSAERMSCANSDSTEDCVEESANYNGWLNWDSTSRDLMAGGSELYVYSVGADIAGSVISGVAHLAMSEEAKESKKNKGKKKQSKGTSIGGGELAALGASAVGGTISFFAQYAQMFAIGAIILGGIMQLIMMLPEFIGQYAQITISLTLALIPFTLLAIIISVIVTFDYQGLKKIVINIFKQMLEPIMTNIYFAIIPFALSLMLGAMFKMFPIITSKVTNLIAGDLSLQWKYFVSFAAMFIVVMFYSYLVILIGKKIAEIIQRTEEKDYIGETVGGAIDTVQKVTKTMIGVGVLGGLMRMKSRSYKKLREQEIQRAKAAEASEEKESAEKALKAKAKKDSDKANDSE